jgi:3-dehydroquinate dehydratase/shikimate dehydrogenase
MICVSINQESRRLALADMLNAARQGGDLLEVRLDRFGKAPDVGELIASKPRPVIFCCRRPVDGGNWDGTEDDRLAILRQCIVSKADYVEIELDIADQIRPFPPSQRVIAYTNLGETPPDILEIYEEARTKKPDVIKLVTLARTPEEAWPLVQILARATVPTVVVGLGRSAAMLAVLGKKLAAPWGYAALERGMEAYPGQPSVADLDEIYRFRDIGKGTRLIGVTGFSDQAQITAAVLNAVFAHEKLAVRCLPLTVGDLKVFRKIIDASKLLGVVVDPEHQAVVKDIGAELHGAAKQTQVVDVLFHKNDVWHGVHVSCQAWVEALAEKLTEKHGGAHPFKDRMIMIAGITAGARLLAAEVQKLGAGAILASRRRKEGQQVAQEIACRFVAFDGIYATMHDALVVCDEERAEAGRPGTGIFPGYLKSGMTVMDLTAGAAGSELLREAAIRGCLTVQPLDLLVSLLEQQARVLTGKTVPRAVIADAIPARFKDED